MQLTIDSTEPLDRILQVIGALYGVQLAVADPPAPVLSGTPARGRRDSRRATKSVGPAAPAGSRRGGGRGAAGPDATAVRQWARENGYQVSDRGRIPAALRTAYDAARVRS